ncbi:unnamed protein product [Phytophthora lilii]|uniref:Unnamed protein product n=1 Tax=Phytophthora lilii TaxID=2077276 RepID=A0A9W7CNK1_9STRA|nr:unnamed protein product [Phytophthora lilii]
MLQKAGTGPMEQITIRMKLLWVSNHTFNQIKLAKLHFTDEQSPKPLQDQLSVRLKVCKPFKDVSSLIFEPAISCPRLDQFQTLLAGSKDVISWKEWEDFKKHIAVELKQLKTQARRWITRGYRQKNLRIKKAIARCSSGSTADEVQRKKHVETLQQQQEINDTVNDVS